MVAWVAAVTGVAVWEAQLDSEEAREVICRARKELAVDRTDVEVAKTEAVAEAWKEALVVEWRWLRRRVQRWRLWRVWWIRWRDDVDAYFFTQSQSSVEANRQACVCIRFVCG